MREYLGAMLAVSSNARAKNVGVNIIKMQEINKGEASQLLVDMMLSGNR